MNDLGRTDRRRTSRRVPDARDALARVRLRGGRELAVLDISRTGVLLEGTSRLLPGTHVDVHVTTREGRVLVRARVMRAVVSRVQAESITYRAALAFETLVDTAAHGYPLPVDASNTGASYPGDEGPDKHQSAKASGNGM